MGSFCSKPGTHSGGHTVLGSSNGDHGPAQASLRNESADERRERMAQAARDRQQKDLERLTNKKNPNAGRLASQVNKPVKPFAQERQDEPLRYD